MLPGSRTVSLALAVGLLLVGGPAVAQMPITQGKGGAGRGIDDGIFGERIIDRLVAPRIQPPERIEQARPRMLTLEPPAPEREEAEDDPEAPPEARAPRRQAVPLNLQTSVIGRENFDRWIFGDGVDEVARRDRLGALVGKKVESASRERGLTAEQSAKLALAGHGDVKRFFDRVEARRPEFEVARKDFRVGLRFLNSIDSLGLEFEEGPFGAGSMFAKTLRKIEADAQGVVGPGK